MHLYDGPRRTHAEFVRMGTKRLWELLQKTYHKAGTIRYTIDRKDYRMSNGLLNRQTEERLRRDVEELRDELKEMETDAEMIFRALPAAELNEMREKGKRR